LQNIILTKNKELHKETNRTLFTDKQPQKLLEYLASNGRHNITIIGGGIINSLFMKAGVVDELILSIHPLVLGNGIKLFADDDFNIKLKLIESKCLKEDLVQIRYRISKDKYDPQ